MANYFWLTFLRILSQALYISKLHDITSRFVIQILFNACLKHFFYLKTLSKSLVPYSDLRKEIACRLYNNVYKNNNSTKFPIIQLNEKL